MNKIRFGSTLDTFFKWCDKKHRAIDFLSILSFISNFLAKQILEFV